jgi:hypothetical protein
VVWYAIIAFTVLLEDALGAAPHKAIKSDSDLTVQPSVT